jgi:hypothetical protein
MRNIQSGPPSPNKLDQHGKRTMGDILGAMAAFLVAALVFIDRSHNMAAPDLCLQF